MFDGNPFVIGAGGVDGGIGNFGGSITVDGIDGKSDAQTDGAV